MNCVKGKNYKQLMKDSVRYVSFHGRPRPDMNCNYRPSGTEVSSSLRSRSGGVNAQPVGACDIGCV